MSKFGSLMAAPTKRISDACTKCLAPSSLAASCDLGFRSGIDIGPDGVAGLGRHIKEGTVWAGPPPLRFVHSPTPLAVEGNKGFRAIATQSVLFPDLFEERPLTSLRASC